MEDAYKMQNEWSENAKCCRSYRKRWGSEEMREKMRFVTDVSASSIRGQLKRLITSSDAMHAADVKNAEARGEAKGEAKGEARGEARGEAKGKAESQRDFAQKLIADGFKYDKIAQLTGLSVGKVKEISLAAANS